MSSTRMQVYPAAVADHVHDLGFAGAFAALVDDRQRRVDALGEPTRAHHAADIGRHHHDIAEVETFPDVAHHHRRGVEIIGRNVEEALDLPGVQVERHHAVDAGLGDHIGHQLGRNRRARTDLAVLPGVAEIGDHRRDAARGRPAQRIGDDQQFHQMVVGRKRRRLDDEGVRAADVFVDLDEDFHVGETPDASPWSSGRSSQSAIACAKAGLELPATSLMEPFLADIEASPRALLDTMFSIWDTHGTGAFRQAR